MAVSQLPLKQLFAQHANFVPTRELSKQIIAWRTKYEMRDTHAEAINTPYLGVYRIKFLPKDSQALFDVLGIDRLAVCDAIKQSSVNTNFIVASDAYNLTILWAVHKFFTSNLPLNVRTETCMALYFMLLIKFYSSLVGHRFPHPANLNVMEATINSLSDKFDIKHKETCTWKLIMMTRARELLDAQNIHYNTMKTFVPDAKITYVLTDTETRLRTKIHLVTQEYYKMHDQGLRMVDSTMTDVDKETGDMVVKEMKNNFDTMISSVCNRVVNLNQFIKNDYINISCKMAANVRPDMLRTLLMKFSVLATYQYQKQKSEELDKVGNYRGYRILIRNLIQATYRACIMDKSVNVAKRLSILMKAINLYKSSRINDEAILKVKASVDAIVADAKISSREATNASLKIAFIVYLILMTFDID